MQISVEGQGAKVSPATLNFLRALMDLKTSGEGVRPAVDAVLAHRFPQGSVKHYYNILVGGLSVPHAGGTVARTRMGYVTVHEKDDGTVWLEGITPYSAARAITAMAEERQVTAHDFCIEFRELLTSGMSAEELGNIDPDFLNPEKILVAPAPLPAALATVMKGAGRSAPNPSRTWAAA